MEISEPTNHINSENWNHSFDLNQLNWNKGQVQGNVKLLPCVAQDVQTGQVLVVAFVSAESLAHTLTTGHLTFFSRSREEIWEKGKTSGHYLKVQSLHADCDNDSVLALVAPIGPSCHRGTQSCFEAEPTQESWEDSSEKNEKQSVIPKMMFGELGKLWQTLDLRLSNREKASDSYTVKLATGGLDRILKKVTEEAGEVILAAKNAQTSGNSLEFCEESADLLYHWLLTCRFLNVNPKHVMDVLAKRSLK